jgi:universal stress protein A
VRALIALDFSDCSRLACRWVLDRAQGLGIEEITFHHVLDPGSDDLGSLEKAIAEARAFVEGAQASSPGASVGIRYGASCGKPAEEILEAAKGHAVQMIVMGTNGRTGMNRLLLGSVAESVVRAAPCTVIVVKPSPDA